MTFESTPRRLPLPSSSRFSRRILILTALVFALALIWSGAWWYIASKADELVTAALVREADRGRKLTCVDRHIGGYPFRLEVTCTQATIEIASGRSYRLTSPRIIAAVQLYQPNHIILGAASPLKVDWQSDGASDGEPDTPKATVLTFASIAVSIIRGDNGPKRLSLEANDLVVDLTEETQSWRLIAKAHLELHIRQSDKAPTPGTYDFAATAKALETPIVDVLLKRGSGLHVDLQGTISQIDALRRGSRIERARAWQQAGGGIHVDRLYIERNGMKLKAQGDLKLDEGGYVTGELITSVAGAAAFGQMMKEAGLAPESFASMLKVGLGVLGREGAIDGTPAIEVPLTLSNGRIKAGAFPLGKAPRVFLPLENAPSQ